MNTVQKTLLFGKNFLKHNQIISYDIDAKVLLMFVLNIDKITLLTSDYEISDELYNEYLKVLNRRAKFEPCAYIVNNQEFMSIPFYVDKNVLIPRGDTEILVEEAISLIKENDFKSMLDLCTGQGAIAISTSYYTKINVVASDISEMALDIAKKNAKINNVLNKIEFILSDLYGNIGERTFDIIASNPPYISTEEMEGLMNDVKDYEPRIALTDESNGLTFYEKIINKARKYLNPNGYILLEIGYNQKEEVVKMLEQQNFIDIKVLKDLNGHNRVVCAKI